MRQTPRRAVSRVLAAAGAGAIAGTLLVAPALAKPVDPADVEDAFHRAEIINEQVNDERRV